MTSTWPEGRSVAVCFSRAVASRPVGLHVPVVGSYTSALEKGPLGLEPPVTSTRPEGRSVAVCFSRAVASRPVGLHVPVAGSYTSALERGPMGPEPLGPEPPVTSTWPESNSVAVWLVRGMARVPVGLHVPVAGS
ncbi:hypothetical protein Q664_08055 [Archangium violaceum Cb vi76]|uniref:Uncharacterized protein n=1 Tax=Archangium violaceum Cb vi76 TaxID=1406225 RepID=A0A084SZ17_9BACT|nr:hypothetical protein Q664_08055 [Archangium violaceum Cb vi76]